METSALTFGSPLWLWGIAAAPLLGVFYFLSHRRGTALVAKVVAPRLREQLVGSVSVPRRAARALLVLAAFSLALVALAQPRAGFIRQEIKQKGRDVIIAVDTSRSMLATDVAPNRLARAKLLTQDLLRLLKGDRVGLVAFAGSAFLQAPLTLDYSAVINALDELDTSVIPKGGTNIGAAISIAEEAFGKAEGQIRALIILTDGEELDADGLAAAKKAAGMGVRIFTVGIGSPEGSLIPLRTEDGRQDFVRDDAGKPVQSRLDVARLQEIASATGGFYVPVGVDAARELFQRGIEPMDLVETGVFSAEQPIERYQWPLGFAIAFLIFWLLLGERRHPRNGGGARRVAAGVLLLATQAQAAPTGQENYQAGQFDKARQAFEQRLLAEPDSPALHFNVGAAAYKLGDFDKSLAHFTHALLAEDKKLREDASYNLANSLVRRGEAAKETQAKKADWENAIEHYTEALNINAKNKQAEENRDIVKKLLEELKKQQEQEQKDQDKKDKQDKQDKKDKNQQDKQDKDQQGQQDKQDKDQQGQQDKQENTEKKDGDQKDKSPDAQKNSQGEKENEQKKGDQQKPAPAPTPGDKKEGDLKANSQGEGKEEQPAQPGGGTQEAEEREGEMSAAQARGLLDSLRSEEEKVNLMQQQTSQEVRRDW